MDIIWGFAELLMFFSGNRVAMFWFKSIFTPTRIAYWGKHLHTHYLFIWHENDPIQRSNASVSVFTKAYTLNEYNQMQCSYQHHSPAVSATFVKFKCSVFVDTVRQVLIQLYANFWGVLISNICILYCTGVTVSTSCTYSTLSRSCTPTCTHTRTQTHHLLCHLHTCTLTQTDGQIDIQSVIFAAGKQALRGC